MSNETTDQIPFETIAYCYPHEAYAEWPERFWEYFQRVRPGVSRGDMEAILERTAADGSYPWATGGPQ